MGTFRDGNGYGFDFQTTEEKSKIETWNDPHPHFDGTGPHRYDVGETTCCYCKRPKDWIPTADKTDTDDQNKETSRREVARFIVQRADRVFAYVDEKNRRITTWTGDKLGFISELGRPYRDNFGGTRVALVVCGINGLMYHGTYYTSSGDYCRLRAATRKGRPVLA